MKAQISTDKETPKVVKNFYHCNRIMVAKDSSTIYLPTYLTINIRNFRSLQFQSLIGVVSAQLIIVIYIQDLPQYIVKQLDSLIINLPNHGNILIDAENNKKADIYHKIIKGAEVFKDRGNQRRDEERLDKNIFKQFKILMNFKATMQPYMRLTPFDLVDLILTMSIKTINLSFNSKVSINQKNKLQIKFILMDCQIPQSQIQKKINFNASAVFGQYDLAQKKLHVEYSTAPQQKNLKKLGKYIFKYKFPKQQIPSNQKPEQFVHFHFPLYKFPCIPLLTIMIPLVVLGIINLAIFYQGPGLGDRIGNISALMIAFIGIVPVIRKSIPRTPIITGVEILVYLETFTTIFCLIESLRNRHEQAVRRINHSFLFRLSLIITIFVSTVPLVMLIFHQLYLKRTYNQNVKIQTLNFKDYLENWNKNRLSQSFFKNKIIQNDIVIQIKPQQQISSEKNPQEYGKQQSYKKKFKQILDNINQLIKPSN